MNYEELKMHIIKTFNLPMQVKGIFDIIPFYKSLNDAEKHYFLKVLHDFIYANENKAKCLMIIDLINEAESCEKTIEFCVKNFNEEKDISFAITLMNLSASISSDWGINFIRYFNDKYKNDKNDSSHLYSYSIYCLALSNRWEYLIKEINDALQIFDDEEYVFFMAYFYYKRGKEEFMMLIGELNIKNLNRYKSLSKNIEIRYAMWNPIV